MKLLRRVFILQVVSGAEASVVLGHVLLFSHFLSNGHTDLYDTKYALSPSCPTSTSVLPLERCVFKFGSNSKKLLCSPFLRLFPSLDLLLYKEFINQRNQADMQPPPNSVFP